MDISEITEVMEESQGRRVFCIEKDGVKWTGYVSVFETEFDNLDDVDNLDGFDDLDDFDGLDGEYSPGASICVVRDDGRGILVFSKEIEHIEILEDEEMYENEQGVIVCIGSRYACPVCGEFEFTYAGRFEICPVCGWADNLFQLRNPNEEDSANCMSLNQARRAYARGLVQLIKDNEPYPGEEDDEEDKEVEEVAEEDAE